MKTLGDITHGLLTQAWCAKKALRGFDAPQGFEFRGCRKTPHYTRGDNTPMIHVLVSFPTRRVDCTVRYDSNSPHGAFAVVVGTRLAARVKRVATVPGTMAETVCDMPPARMFATPLPRQPMRLTAETSQPSWPGLQSCTTCSISVSFASLRGFRNEFDRLGLSTSLGAIESPSPRERGRAFAFGPFELAGIHPWCPASTSFRAAVEKVARDVGGCHAARVMLTPGDRGSGGEQSWLE